MKIEIELEEIESLKNEIHILKVHIESLEKQLKGLDVEELKKRAVSLSYKLFDNYMEAVFIRLGFGKWERDSVVIHDNLVHWIGKDWWNSDRVSFELGATVTNKFKRAFLDIGIIPNKEDVKEDIYQL